MPEAAAPVKGTRPEGAATEADASKKVREMFTEIAPRYDLLNHLLSLQLDRLWRARAAKHLRPLFPGPEIVVENHKPVYVRLETSVLDLCCGTGDLAIELNRRYYAAQVIGVDFSHRMLIRARKKSERLHSKTLAQHRPIRYIEADALRLPFADGTFDLVTTAFGFRNLANYEAGLREIQRVLKPGGTVAILEFTEPPEGMVGDLYRWYFCRVLPKIGGLISGDQAAYKYLPKSVARFFRPPELAALLTAVGYQSVNYRVWTLGTVALHTGLRANQS
jgi:demethylmenaquinone methyltransferase / 2-methoxy-6-polyprenyl-1,4-benzoquinol methylase